MLTKYAEVADRGSQVEVLDGFAVPENVGAKRLARLRRKAHRHHFEYTPRRGYIYVRSRAISSRCNDNFDEFPAAEIKKAYRTFIGKPVFVNHHNADHRRARGVIVDAALHEDTNPDGSEDTWAEVLMEVDAVRFPVLAREVLKGNIARTSMGTDVAYSVCTACGNKASTPADYCQHIPKMKGMKHRRYNAATGGQEEVLIAERCYGLGFFENSLLVEDPADPTAFGWVDHDASGLSVAAAKAVIEEAETITRSATRREAFPSRRDMADTLEGRTPHPQQRQAPKAPKAPTAPKSPAKPREPNQWDRAADAQRAEDEKRRKRLEKQRAADPNPDWAARGQEYDRTHPRKASAVEALIQNEAAMHVHSYGETKAPTKVDTMRAENCPVCGDDEGYNGDKCSVCGYMQPPSQFTDPDLTKARENDLRQDQEQAPMPAEVGKGLEDPAPTDPLQCTNCGEVFSAEGEPAPDPDDDAEEAEPEAKAEDDNPFDTKDSDGEAADDDESPDDVADLSDDEIFADDEEEEADPDDEAQDPEDPASVDPAVGEGRITSEPVADPRGLDDIEITPNMTCPICGEGTLVPQAGQEPEGEEPKITEVGTDPTRKPKETVGMTQQQNPQNPAQQRRSQIIAAIAEQQGEIDSLKRVKARQEAHIGHLTRAVAALSLAAGVDKHPHFAGIVRAAGLTRMADTNQGDSAGEKPATSTEEAAKPDATDDVENVGAAPAAANEEVTPEGVTDVNNSDVVANPPVLDHLQDVTAPTSGTDAVTPAAGDAGGASQVSVGTPSNEAFDKPGDSGWTTSSKERFVASQRLARLQIAAGMETGDDLALAQKIDASKATLGEISAQISTIAAIQQKAASAQPTTTQRRHLVPRSAGQQSGGVQPTRAPSLQSTAGAERIDEDPWLFGSDDLG